MYFWLAPSVCLTICVYTFVWHEPYSHHFLYLSPSPDIFYRANLSYKAMLFKESVLRPEIFQILSASQAKKHTEKKPQDNTRVKVEFFMQ